MPERKHTDHSETVPELTKTIPELAEMIDRYNSHYREALRHLQRAQIYHAGILHYLAGGSPEELRMAQKIAETLYI